MTRNSYCIVTFHYTMITIQKVKVLALIPLFYSFMHFSLDLPKPLPQAVSGTCTRKNTIPRGALCLLVQFEVTMTS